MKLTYLLAFLLFATTAAHAQQKRDTVHASSSTANKTKKKDELGLSKKQQADIKADKKEYKAGKEKIENDSKLTDKEKDEKIKQLKDEKKKKAEATLTPEQREKAKELKKEKKDKKKAEKAKQ